MLDLNTWLAAAVEDQGTEETSQSHGHLASSNLEHDTRLEVGPSAAATMDIARLDLDPPGFTCKAFHDLPVSFELHSDVIITSPCVSLDELVWVSRLLCS